MANQEKNPGWITRYKSMIIAKDFNYFAETSFERYFSKKIESALNTNDKTIVSIIQNDWLEKTEIYDAYINSFTTAKRNCHSGKLFSSW
jgi:hypothetical protein